MPQTQKASNPDTWVGYPQNLAAINAIRFQLDPERIRQVNALSYDVGSLLYQTAPSVYLLDYTSGEYVIFSQNFSHMGFRPEAFLESGVAYTIDHYHPDHLPVFNKQIFPDRLAFLKTIPPEEHPHYIFSHQYRLRNARKEWVQVWQRSVFLQSDSAGNPLVSMGVVVDISHLYNRFAPVKQIVEKTRGAEATVVLEKVYAVGEEGRLFTRREKEIIRLLAGGFSSKQIAARLFISEGTVQAHRKNMLQKCNLKNVAELVHFAAQSGII